MVTGYIRVTGDTKYTASLANFTGSDKKIIFGFYAQDKSWISIDTQSYASNYSRTTTTPQNCAFVRIQFSKYDSWSDNDVTNANFMFESGSTATAYQPYQSGTYSISLGSIELCKIGDYQDYIYKSGDEWYVHKEITSKLFKGDEGWVSRNYSDGIRYFYNNSINDGVVVDASTIYPLLSKYYPAKANSELFNHSVDYGAAISNTEGIRIRNADISSTGDFKTWLSTHNTTVYYALATATDTKITDNTLIGQLNAVNNATLPTPVAFITVNATDTNLPGPLKISYYGEEE